MENQVRIIQDLSCPDAMLARPVREGVADVWGEKGGEEEDPCLQVQSGPHFQPGTEDIFTD